ncbi:MAG: diacylglycerol/lipid kinase family protein [Omnitrophica WOR_2 bacterium]
MRRALLVYNPVSGRYPSLLLAERAARVLGEHGWQLTIEQAQSGEHITRLAYQAAAQGLDAYFIAGGDGSINLALEGLVGSNTALGVLPSGTANVWAQELGLPGLSWTRWSALEESARRLADAEVFSVDAGSCNGKPFLLWAGIGLDAFIVHHIEPRSPWEKHFAAVHYAASAAWNASFWHGMNLRVEVERQEVSGHFLLALVSNIHLYIGGMAEISPDARLDDGVMDLWLFKGETLGDTVQLMWDLISGRHLQSDQVFRRSIQSVTMNSDSDLYLQMDGEPVYANRPFEIKVLQKALRVLVPSQTPRSLFF